MGNLALSEPVKAALPPLHAGENFVLDWRRSVSEDLIRQFIQGLNRTPKQLANVTATWELNHRWNHGNTPDSSMYTKRIVEEALWLQPRFGWSLQDVVDIVITFCKKNQLHWSPGRAKKQIADGFAYIERQTCQRGGGGGVDFDSHPFEPTPPFTLTCNGGQIIETENGKVETGVNHQHFNNLRATKPATSRDTFACPIQAEDQLKLSRAFKHNSVRRDAVVQGLSKYLGWVKAKTIAAGTGMTVEAAKKQLQRLQRWGLVDGDGKGRYRKNRERRPRRAKPCFEKPFPQRKNSKGERKTLSRGELTKRGWPKTLIDEIFPRAETDYVAKKVEIEGLSRTVHTRLYWVSRIRAMEGVPWFETYRSNHLAAARERKVAR